MTDSTDPEIPAPLRENLYVVVEELTDHEGLLVALDFDGTLAAIERRPDEATIPESTREAVAALADHPQVEVAVVSGRELADVRERVGIPDISYAGNHGLEIHTEEYDVHPEARAAEATIGEISDLLTDQLAEIEGVIVEHKGVTATVHHRLVDDEAVPVVENAVESLVASRDDVRLTTGKDVLELRPAVEWDKGEAVRELYDELVPDEEAWLPMYVGDDTTDEAAFAVLDERGLAVKVGENPDDEESAEFADEESDWPADEESGGLADEESDGLADDETPDRSSDADEPDPLADTEAPYRVADPEAVRAVLSWLHEYGVEFLEVDHHAVPIGSA